MVFRCVNVRVSTLQWFACKITYICMYICTYVYTFLFTCHLDVIKNACINGNEQTQFHELMLFFLFANITCVFAFVKGLN